jgi:orotate phosphoribosyltransferase
MTQDSILNIFRSTEALLEGHFILTSGKHSDRYFQCAKVLQYPEHSRALCAVIAKAFDSGKIDVVIAPAVGGIVVCYEVACQLNARAIFAEREEGAMTLRRGFALKPGERVLVCEDVTTTGGSVMEIIELVKLAGATLVGVGCIVDRSGGAFNPEPRFVSCMKMQVTTYPPDACPLCASGSTAVKPGSRGLAAKK